MDILSLVVFLIIIGLCFWAVNTLSGAFGIPSPVVTVIQVILVIIIVLYLLQFVRVMHGVGLPRLGAR
jgi:hypothetical protein